MIDPLRASPSAPSRAAADRRTWLGAALGAAGVIVSFLGWWGVSAKPSLAEQLPYLASGSIPGAALIVAAAVLLASERSQQAADRTAELVEALHGLLVEAVRDPAGPGRSTPPDDSGERIAAGAPSGAGDLVALAGGEHVHRAECTLVAGKDRVERITSDEALSRRLTPCPVCTPELSGGDGISARED